MCRRSRVDDPTLPSHSLLPSPSHRVQSARRSARDILALHEAQKLRANAAAVLELAIRAALSIILQLSNAL